MKNPIKFIQEVKQEAFKVTWPTSKETLQGALMVFAMAVVMSLFFLLLDQVLKFFLELDLTKEKIMTLQEPLKKPLKLPEVSLYQLAKKP